MWTYEGALVTLDTFINIPFWNINSDTTFFISSSTYWECTIFNTFESTYRKFITFLTVHWILDIFNEIRNISICIISIFSIFPRSWNFYFMKSFDTFVDSAIIHINDMLTFFTIRSNNCIFKIFNSFINRNDICKFKECRLHNHVKATAKTEFLSNFNSVYSIEVNIVFCNITFHICREFFC